MSRFALQRLVPAQAERLIHVMLWDKDRPGPYAVAARHGAAKVEALPNLRVRLIGNHVSPEANDYVAVAHPQSTRGTR